MAVTPASFRADYPEFANATTFPDAWIIFHINIAYILFTDPPWDVMLDPAVELYIAHNLVLDAKDAVTVSAGGVPGNVNGVLSSKAVDTVSAGYDTGAVTMPDAGQWNMTRFGIRLYQLIRMFGAGGIQIGPWP